mmetsp:Transcript_13431/g.29050  ORF Transcript_13431/g.29050 Transcript_13431/m.29050 type:complete len:265 (-) Transcript_13431:119-913(-)
MNDQQLLQRNDAIEIHAWLLIWSWAFLLPAGALIWRQTKKHSDLQPSPYMHVLLTGVIGLILAIAGFAYGIAHFNTFSRKGSVDRFRMAHAVIGTIATAGMMGQVFLLACMRRANVVEDAAPIPEECPAWQKAGHRAHRYLGYLWMAFGLIACETGTHLASVTDPEYAHLGLDRENERYAGGFIIALCMMALAVISMVVLTDWTAEAARAVAPEPYEKPRERSQGSARDDVEMNPPREVFEIGELEMEEDADVVISQFRKQRAQ